MSTESNGGKMLLAFLFESDLPWPLQVFWKLLTWSLAGLLFYAASAAPSTEGAVVISIFAASFVLIGLFTKLGDG